MTDQSDTTLEVATLSEAALLANLLQLYLHDLSGAFPAIQLGPDGRFGYPWLPLYWSEPERRFPFLIREGGRVVGFALATRGSPASDDPDVFDVAELFVIRQHRRTGVGRRAAILLWDRLPGRWIVRASEGNPGAVPFWSAIVSEYTGGAAVRSQRQGNPHLVQVFSFASPLAGRAGSATPDRVESPLGSDRLTPWNAERHRPPRSDGTPNSGEDGK